MSRIGAGMLLHGEVLTVDEVLARVEALTLDDVHDAARAVGGRSPHPLGGRAVRRVRLRRHLVGSGLRPVPAGALP